MPSGNAVQVEAKIDSWRLHRRLQRYRQKRLRQAKFIRSTFFKSRSRLDWGGHSDRNQRPAELAVGFSDRMFIDAGVTRPHQFVFGELQFSLP
jgi:hypothetical protein